VKALFLVVMRRSTLQKAPRIDYARRLWFILFYFAQGGIIGAWLELDTTH
jgi:hypothetical protein